MPLRVREPGPAAATTVDELIEDRFRAQAATRPNAVALVCDGQRLTYRELYRRAMAVARGLAALGVARETTVGVAFGRSIESIVATLGVVLAGGAYVPVNPTHPPHRISQIVTLSGTRIVICAAEARERIAASVGKAVVVLELSGLDGPEVLVPHPRPGRSPLCCVMYTSGSTGQPKGVAIEHRGVLRLVAGQEYFDFGPHHTFLHAAAPEFDASLFEVWGALLNGATLCVIDHETAVVPWRYAQALLDNKITVAWLTAPLFARMADENPGMFGSLSTLLTGGDVVSPRHVDLVRERNPALLVCNGYGPTENTTFTSVYPVVRAADGPLPIGRPIAGTTVLVCDESGAPVPPGVPGELFIGGRGLARGYFGQPKLTRERFVHVDGERYYRTGDRVHVDRDGVLHFHGRWDDQVKINGNLVELKEVAAALCRVPGVRDAHCRVVGVLGQDRHLAAYLVAPGRTEREIRTELRALLPAYLIPAALFLLDRFPLLDNGKIDANALPVSITPAAAKQVTPEHRAIARLWAEVLDVPVESVGPDSDFTELGGNSIRLGVLLGRIHRRTGVRIPLQDAFETRTLDEMCAVVAAGTASPIAAIRAVRGMADLHPQQRGLYAIWHADPSSLAYNVPVRMEIRGLLDPRRLRDAFLATVAQHDALRMKFVLADGVVRQYPVADVEPEFREGRTAESFVRPFGTDEPVVPRALLAGQELYVDFHHIAFDGVSLGVFVKELLARYAGEVPVTPAVRYADAAQWSHDQGVRPDDEKYWLGRLAGAQAPAWPTDRPRGARRTTAGAVVCRVLDIKDLVARVAARRGTTSYVVLLAAYFATLARISGQRDITVGSPASGRSHPAMENVIGMFVNTVCLRAEIDARASFGELIDQVALRSREALAHQAVPHSRIAERLGVPKDPARNLLFDAFFAVHDIEFGESRNGELGVTVELLNPGTTRFDLNMQIHPRRGRLTMDLEYATGLFDRSSAEYLLDEYVSVLNELLLDPAASAVPARTGAAPVVLPDFDFDF